MLAQEQLRLTDTAIDERRGGNQQTRILGRGLDVPGIGGIGTLAVADQGQMIADRAPRIGHRRLEGDGTAPSRQGRSRLSRIGEADTEFVVRRRPVGLLAREGLQDL